MLPWEMLLLLGYHQLTPCSIFRRRLGVRRVGEGTSAAMESRRKRRKDEFSSPQAASVSTMDALVSGQTRTGKDVQHSQQDQLFQQLSHSRNQTPNPQRPKPCLTTWRTS